MMRILREVDLELVTEPEAPSLPRFLRARVVELPGGACELLLEDRAGNVRFAYRDRRRFLVLEEFEITLADLEPVYRVVARAAVVHG